MAKNKSANSGVDAISGFDFQRNCALYLLLNDYDNYKDRDFFLCIEHHDDFLFCFRADSSIDIKEVQAYQAKKLSGKIWTINSRFSELISKMLEVGNSLRDDSAPKSGDYSHKLTFISNTESDLRYKPSKAEKEKGKKEESVKINEQLCVCKYDAMPEVVKNKIYTSVEEHCNEVGNIFHQKELDELHIQWIDFPRTLKNQKEYLVGLLNRKFRNVSDPTAAVDLLLNLFKEVESVYNQGRIISLMDTSKRVLSEEITKTIKIITTKSKAFDYWRSQKSEVCKTLEVLVTDRETFALKFESAFDLFKDLEQTQHTKILNFVRDNINLWAAYTEADTIVVLSEQYQKNNSINFSTLDLKAIIYAAFFEVSLAKDSSDE